MTRSAPVLTIVPVAVAVAPPAVCEKAMETGTVFSFTTRQEPPPAPGRVVEAELDPFGAEIVTEAPKEEKAVL